MKNTDATKKTKSRAKGQQPYFFDDPNTDRLLTMVMVLASELSVLRERLDTNERVSEAKNLYSASDIENFEMTDSITGERERWRDRFLSRLLSTINERYDREV